MSKLLYAWKDTRDMRGLQGDKGDKGDTGLQGIKGDIGDTGLQGNKGDTGLQGNKGNTGDTGLQGNKGDTGDTGLQGIKGDTGDRGLQGIKGDNGLQGIPGDSSSNNISLATLLNIGIISPIQQIVFPDGNRVTLNTNVLQPISAWASSVSGPWVASNIFIKDDTWWMSEIDSGNDEWVAVDFGSKVLLSSIYCSAGSNHNGGSNKIQVSIDSSNWSDIHIIYESKWQINSNNQTYQNVISTSNAYQYARLISTVSSYCLYDFIQYYGIK